MDQIDDILAKHFSNLNLADDEQETLLKWKALNEQEYNVIKQTYNAVEDYKFVEFDTTKGWKKMSKRMNDNKRSIFTLKPIIKYSIAASIAILIGITGFQFLKNTPPEFIVFENNNSSTKQIELPDGSVINLAKNSTLAYHPDFENHRNIRLNGNAFFDVFRNEKNPFTIHTAFGNITVLGTSFNINTLEKRTQVDVKTGLVQLTVNNKLIKLSVGESAWSDGINISPKEQVGPNYLAWKTGKFYFDNTPITVVIKFLESFYGDVIDANIETNDCAFTGSFSNQNVDEIIEALVLSCNLEFSKEDNRFILK